MKGNKKLLVIAILLLMMSVGFTTYAIYRESATATGTVGAAAWNVKVKRTGSSDNEEAIGSAAATTILAFDQDDITWNTSTRTGKNGKIAPGDSGTISFDVNALGSEVDVIVEAEIGNITGLPAGMTATVTSGTNGKQEIGYSTTNMSTTVVVTITWNGTIADEASKDGTDLAKAGTNLSIPVVLKARQKLASDS